MINYSARLREEEEKKKNKEISYARMLRDDTYRKEVFVSKKPSQVAAEENKPVEEEQPQPDKQEKKSLIGKTKDLITKAKDKVTDVFKTKDQFADSVNLDQYSDLKINQQDNQNLNKLTSPIKQNNLNLAGQKVNLDLGVDNKTLMREIYNLPDEDVIIKAHASLEKVKSDRSNLYTEASNLLSQAGMEQDKVNEILINFQNNRYISKVPNEVSQVKDKEIRTKLENTFKAKFELDTAEKYYQEIADKDVNDKNYFGNFKDGLFKKIKNKDAFKDYEEFSKTFVPFKETAGIFQESQTKIVSETEAKLQKGEEVTAYEKAIYDKYTAQTFNNQSLPQDTSDVVIDALLHMPKYGLEFYLSAGIFTGAKATVESALLANKVPALVSKAVGFLAGTTTQTATAFSGQVKEKTNEFVINNSQVKFNENNQAYLDILDNDGDFKESFFKNLPKGFAYELVEITSEYSGDVLDYIKKGLVNKTLIKNAVGQSDNFIREFLKKSKWDGLLIEALEEEVAELGQAPLEDRKYQAPILTSEGTQRFITSLLVSGIYGSIFKIGERVVDGKKEPVVQVNEEEVTKLDNAMKQITSNLGINPNLVTKYKDNTMTEEDSRKFMEMPVIKEAYQKTLDKETNPKMIEFYKKKTEEAIKKGDLRGIISQMVEANLSDTNKEALGLVTLKADAGKDTKSAEDILKEAEKDNAETTPKITQEKKESKVIAHGTARTLDEVRKTGLYLSRNAMKNLGEAVYFTDSESTQQEFGENKVEVNANDFNWKTLNTLQEEQDYLREFEVDNVADAIRKEGKYDGFIIPNTDSKVGTTYGIVNQDKVNSFVKKQSIFLQKPQTPSKTNEKSEVVSTIKKEEKKVETAQLTTEKIKEVKIEEEKKEVKINKDSLKIGDKISYEDGLGIHKGIIVEDKDAKSIKDKNGNVTNVLNKLKIVPTDGDTAEYNLSDTNFRNIKLISRLEKKQEKTENKKSDKVAEDYLKLQIGDTFEIVEPVGNMWKPKGNTIFIKPNRDNPGYVRWLRDQNFIDQVDEAGNGIYKVTVSGFEELNKKSKKKPQKVIAKDYANKEIEERTETVTNFIKAKTGKELNKVTVKELKENLTDGDVFSLNEKSQIILDKVASKSRGINMKPILEGRPGLFYGGVSRNVFTDGSLMILDKQAATKLNTEIFDKEVENTVKRLQKVNPELNYEEAKTIAKEQMEGYVEENKQKEKYPDYKKIIPTDYSSKEPVILGFNTKGEVYLTDGDTNVIVNGNMLKFMQDRLPDSEMRFTSGLKPIVFLKDGEITGLLMPMNQYAGFPFQKAEEKKSTKSTSSSGSQASMDLYADIPNQTQQEIVKTKIPFPEMVRLAKDLIGKYPVIKMPRMRPSLGGRPYGLFVPSGDGSIILNPEIFNNVDQAAKTLAHEMGHLTDYLPDKNLARGNLIGRIASLNQFTKQKFTNHATETKIRELEKQRSQLQEKRRSLEKDENGKVLKSLKNRDLELLRKIRPINKEIRKLQENAIKNKVVKEELKQLTKLWRPFDEEAVGDDYLNYRYSPKELYADAISVLLNDPVLLQKEAPVFNESFFKFLHNKPTVQKEYFALIDFLNKPDEVIQTKRLDDLYEGFAEAKAKREEIEQKEKPEKPVFERIMSQHVTKYDPMYRMLNKKYGKQGIFLSPATEVRMQLEETDMRANEVYLYLNKINKDIIDPVESLGMTEEDLGILLTLERNLENRKDIANPYGLQGEYAQETLTYFKDYLKKKRNISDEQFDILQQVARKFRAYQFEIVKEATENQLYSKQLFKETLEPNKDSYVTYQVVEYIHKNHVSAGIKKAVGTLKPIENPLVSSIMKTVAVINQTEIQKGKLKVIDQLTKDFPEDISKSKPQKARAGVQVGWKPVENRVPLKVYEDGKQVAYDVDPYIARMFDYYPAHEIHNLVKASGAFNRFFKPLVTTYNISWGFYSNIIRDTKRTYKNLGALLPNVGSGKNVSIFEFFYRWFSAIPESYQYQKGELSPLMEEMLKTKAYTTAFSSFNAKANEDKAIAPIMRKFRFLPQKEDVKNISAKRKLWNNTIGKLLEGIEFAGSIFETNTKVAGYQILKNREVEAKQAGFITRDYVGTPNFLDGGTQKYIDNQVFVFSNVMAQGVRTDIELATDPQTKSGYWYRTFIVDILPKMMMLAAASGLLGKALKDMFDRMTEYDKTNYITVPLGIRENGKVTYIRIPQDETGRFFSAMVWKLGSYINGDLKKPEQILALGAGYLPSVTPMWEIGGAWLNYAQGRNPYDSYRGRQVVDDTTWKAGGMPVFKKMVQYTTNTMGLSQFSTYSDETDTTFDLVIKQIPGINRALRSTDYGLTEKEQVIQQQIEQENARRLLREKEYLNEAVKKAKDDPSKQKEIENQLVSDVIGEIDSSEKNTKRNALVKKFNIGIVKGSISRELDSLIEANTNDYKVELFRLYKTEMEKDKYKSLIEDGLKYKIISDEVVKRLKSEGLYYIF